MSWFRRKREPEFEIITNDIPLTTVQRWYLYDTNLTDEVNDIAEIIGLSRISEEGEAKEKEDSEERLVNILPLFPYLEAMAEHSANVMTAIHTKEIIDKNLDEDEEEAAEVLASMFSVYKAIALSTLVGTFSTALHLGLVTTTAISSNTIYDEGEYDDE